MATLCFILSLQFRFMLTALMIYKLASTKPIIIMIATHALCLNCRIWHYASHALASWELHRMEKGAEDNCATVAPYKMSKVPLGALVLRKLGIFKFFPSKRWDCGCSHFVYLPLYLQLSPVHPGPNVYMLCILSHVQKTFQCCVGKCWERSVSLNMYDTILDAARIIARYQGCCNNSCNGNLY